MGTKFAPIAFGVSVAATAGCMAALPSVVATQAAVEHIDLSRGAPAPAGYGKVTLEVTGLPGARQLQSFNTQGASLSIAVTKPGSHDWVTDAAGNTALYEVKVNSGAATVTLPAMPNTKSAPTTSSPFYDASTAYIFTCFLLKTDSTSAPEVGDVSAYGTANGTNSGYRWDKLFADVDAFMLSATAPRLLGSGSSRADVVPGLPVLVTIRNNSHVNRNFIADDPAVSQFDNAVYVLPSGANSAGIVTEDGTAVLRLRIPGLDPATVPANGGSVRHVRAAVAFASSTSNIKLTATAVSPDTGLPAATLLSNVTLGTSLPGSTNTTTTNFNAGRTHYTDIPVQSLSNGTRNIVDLAFTGFASYTNVLLLPLYYPRISSNGNGGVNFD
ncbi:MAG: hypothetical protein FJZ01_26435 [Candidatus Sericytochromatia bacterium]|nr:hypothetical protein [Candidatus Tanganyikabacteria bacterium]